MANIRFQRAMLLPIGFDWIVGAEGIRTYALRTRKSIFGSKLKSVETDWNCSSNPFQWVLALSLRFISGQLRQSWALKKQPVQRLTADGMDDYPVWAKAYAGFLLKKTCPDSVDILPLPKSYQTRHSSQSRLKIDVSGKAVGLPLASKRCWSLSKSGSGLGRSSTNS
jgi:hypothetical protein